MKNSILPLTVFGILIIFGIFTYYPVSDTVSLTNNPFGTIDTYEVDGNWQEEGNIINLQNSHLYAPANKDGTWTSFIQEQSGAKEAILRAEGDPRDGTVNLTVRGWEKDPENTAPNLSYTEEMTVSNFEKSLNVSPEYNFYELEIYMDETAGTKNEIPNIERISLEWVNEDRQFGLKPKDFQIYTFFLFVGATIMAFIRSGL